MRVNRSSRPVGFSGAKKRCGRSHDASSATLALAPLDREVALGSLGVQSISSVSSGATGGAEPRDGRPNTGALAAMTGLEERERDEKRSGSGTGEDV